jgi:hypothetical protein
MKRSHESAPRTYTEDELAGLFATYFGDKLTQTQLDSLVATVTAAHSDRRKRATPRPEHPGPDIRAPALAPDDP